MFDRKRLGVLLLIGIALPIAGCTSSQVDTLEVTPNTINMVAGATAQLTATGVYNHGTGPSTTQNLTNVVTWTTGSVDVATVSNTGLVTAVGPGTIQITASIKGFTGLLSAYSTITVPTPTTGGGGSGDITSLTVTPGSQTVSAPGDQATFNVVGNTASGSVNLTGQIVCSSSSTDIATVTANGTTCVATAVAPGTATIEAQFTNADSTVASGTATFTVSGTGTTNTDITAITIIPGNQSVPQPGDTATFVAVGTTGAGTTVSLTGQVTWNTSAPQIATINAAGVATAVGAGSTTVTAQFMNADKTTATGTATLTVTGSGTTNGDIAQVSIVPTNQTVAAPGDTATFTATGTTSSGVTKSLTNVVWSASSPEIGTIDNTGVATAVGQGTTTISALYTNADSTVAVGTATFTVTASGSSNNDITAITVIPGSQSVAAPGETATFVAIGTTASGATVSMQGLATYSTSSSSIAEVLNSATGTVEGLAAGTATITASYTNADKTVATGTATFTVLTGANETYTSMTISPASQSIPSGGTSDFIALATSGTTGLIEDVTTNPNIQWTSSIPDVAIITPQGGVATGKSAGTSTITALLKTGTSSVVSSTADLTVTVGTPPEDILSLTIIPNQITVNNFYLTGQFLAIATYSTSPYVQDVTNSANTTWISTEPELFPVDTNSGGTPGASAGLVTAYASGGAVIVAETTNKDKTIQTATSTFNCPEVLPEPGVTNPSCYPNEPPAATLLATLTVYNEGLNTTDWLVTAPSATGTPDVIHCGPAWVPTTQQPGTGSVCTATYPMNITTPAGTPGIVITATGGAFGGWSYNCIPSDKNGKYLTGPNPWTAAGPNYCVLPFEGSYTYVNSSNQIITVTVDGLNQTVGAIFN